jgi:hypothetical protein
VDPRTRSQKTTQRTLQLKNKEVFLFPQINYTVWAVDFEAPAGSSNFFLFLGQHWQKKQKTFASWRLGALQP